MKETTNNLNFESDYNINLSQNFTCTSINGTGFNIELNGFANIEMYIFIERGNLDYKSQNLTSDDIHNNILTSQDCIKFNLFEDSAVLNQSSINYYFGNIIRNSTWPSSQNAFSVDVSNSGENTIYNIYTVSYKDGTNFIPTSILLKKEGIPLLNYMGFKKFIDVNTNDIGDEEYIIIKKMCQFREIIFQPPKFTVSENMIDYSYIENIYLNSLKFLRIKDIWLYKQITGETSFGNTLLSYYDIWKFLLKYFNSVEMKGDGFKCFDLLLSPSDTNYNQLLISLAGLGVIGNNKIMFNINSLYSKDTIYDWLSSDKTLSSDELDEILYSQYIIGISDTISFQLKNSIVTYNILKNFYSFNTFLNMGENLIIEKKNYKLECSDKNINITSYSVPLSDGYLQDIYFTIYIANELSYTNELNVDFKSYYYININSYVRYIKYHFDKFYNVDDKSTLIIFDKNYNNIKYLIN